MHANITFSDPVCKTAVISLVSLNLTQKSQNVQLELHHHNIKFQPDQIESGAYKHGRYETIWLNSLHVMSNIKVFAT